jgi:hypothetical protein
MYVQSEFAFSRKLAAAVHAEYRSTGDAQSIGGESAGIPTTNSRAQAQNAPARARGRKLHEDLAVSIEPSRCGPEAESGYEQQGRPQ